ncbi:zinc finger protein [Marseillevirus Shanghai 1]|nr:zinc finger protein [Marseillevirus Shanghai 1]
MGSRKQTQEGSLFECKTCDYGTDSEREMQEHAKEHYEKLGMECDMKCNVCQFEADSASLLWTHFEKKRHKAAVLYSRSLSCLTGKNKEYAAYRSVVDVYGGKTALKIRCHDPCRTCSRGPLAV